MNNLKTQKISLSALTKAEANAKIHTAEQIQHIKNSIQKFGMNDPIGVWGNKNIIVEGEGRYLACKELGINEVECIRLDHLTDEERRAYAIAHNMTQQETGFNLDILSSEIEKLDFNFNDFGIDLDLEIPTEAPNIIVDENESVEKVLKSPNILQNLVPITLGDIFEIGNHRLIYGDSTDKNNIEKLMNGKLANMIFTDSPYNLSCKDIGSVATDENFIMGAGEFTDEEFTDFLTKIVNNLYDFSVENSLHYICMDWRHLLHLLTACKRYDKIKMLYVWIKHQAKPTFFYCSQHELIYIFQKGKGIYTNNIANADNKSNVWNYPGQSHTKFEEMQECERIHPTMKPIKLIIDLIKNSSNKNDIILDLFGGSGSTMVASHKTGRVCYMSELDPKYVNVIIRRMLELDSNLKVICNGKEVTNDFLNYEKTDKKTTFIEDKDKDKQYKRNERKKCPKCGFQWVDNRIRK